PLLSLVGSRLLTVKDMQIDFEVGLHADYREPSAAQAGDVDPDSPWPTDTHTPLNVDMGVRRNGESGPVARVTLRVETQPSSEGMARLIHNLDKLI
ncbi:MAG TPA: hypothetical protein DGQ94_14270, partial [Pseudomonas sp.]|nr:hypothetical protein [Pseudomonas sp.]